MFTPGYNQASPLLHHLVHQLLITVHMIILHHSAADGGKQLLRAVDLGLFDRPQIHAAHGALRLRDEINMLHGTLMEHDALVLG